MWLRLGFKLPLNKSAERISLVSFHCHAVRELLNNHLRYTENYLVHQLEREPHCSEWIAQLGHGRLNKESQIVRWFLQNYTHGSLESSVKTEHR